MLTKFSVFGSCACRDIFYSKINENYKNFFEIGKSGVRISLISLMSDPISYAPESLEIHPLNQQNKNLSNWIKIDFDRSFLKEITQDESIEYLMIDTFYDVNWGVFDLGDGKFVTNNVGLNKTDFFKQLKFSRKLTIFDNFEEYYELWTNSCNLFFNFLKINCPSIKIILNTNRHVYNVLKADGSIYESSDFKKHCNLYNGYRDILDEYILKNFDVDVLNFDENTLIDENHCWGNYSLHYEPRYYHDMTNQINEIIKRDSLVSDFDFNKVIRENKRDYVLQKISFNKKYSDFNNMIIDLNDELNEKEEIIEDYNKDLKDKNHEIINKNNHIISIESQLSLKESQIQNMESKLVNKENNINVIKKQLNEKDHNLNLLNQELADRKNNELNYKQQISSLEKNELELINSLQNSSKQLNNKDVLLTESQKELISKDLLLQQKDAQLTESQKELISKDLLLQQKDAQLTESQKELNDKDEVLSTLKQQFIVQLSKNDNKEYCINCFKEEISNNHFEINYLKNNNIVKKILTPFAYVYLIFKSKPKEFFINFKLYRALKDSKCFDIGFYLNNNDDLRGSRWCKYFSPELHYICNGFYERRRFNKKFFNTNSKKELLDYIITCEKDNIN